MSIDSPQILARIVPFAQQHLDGALHLSQQAGWPHRRADWALVASLSQGVAAMKGDRLVGTALCTGFGDHATLNMIIVDHEMRGQGLGRRLMQAAMALAGDRGMALVATPEGMPLYQSLGFRPVGMIEQYQRIVGGVAGPLPVGADLAAVTAMDRIATGMDRQDLLSRIARPGAVWQSGDGFAISREFGRGVVIGPVVARDEATARQLIAAALAAHEGQFTRIDIPEGRIAEAWLGSMGLTRVGGGTAMICGPAPIRCPEFTTYALASQALG